MTDGLLGPLISGLIAGLAVYGLSGTVRGGASSHSGRFWVSYGPAYKAVSIAFFPLSAFVSYAASQAAADQKTLAGVIALIFWLATLYLATEILLVALSYDDDFITYRTLLRRERRIPWKAVIAVRYAPFTQTFTLKTDSYGSISVSPLADGCQALIERAEAHTRRTLE